MNNYEKMAKDFCNKHGIKIDFEFYGKTSYPWDIKKLRNCWQFTIKNKNNDCYTAKFYDSIANTQKGIEKPTEYDLLACLTKYDPCTYENFCNEYGYDIDDKKSKKIFLAVVKEYEGLCVVFGNDEENQELWEDFREIC